MHSTYRYVRRIRAKARNVLIRCESSQGEYVPTMCPDVVDRLYDPVQVSIGSVKAL